MKKEGEKSANLYTGGKKEIEKVIRVPSKSFIRNPEIWFIPRRKQKQGAFSAGFDVVLVLEVNT